MIVHCDFRWFHLKVRSTISQLYIREAHFDEICLRFRKRQFGLITSYIVIVLASCKQFYKILRYRPVNALNVIITSRFLKSSSIGSQLRLFSICVERNQRTSYVSRVIIRAALFCNLNNLSIIEQDPSFQIVEQ